MTMKMEFTVFWVFVRLVWGLDTSVSEDHAVSYL